MTLAPYVRILGVGPGRARSLTTEEAEAAMGVILAGQAAPEAIGAMLMLMRMKGETAGEVAGLVRAARRAVAWEGAGSEGGAPALDWPSYAAGRTRGEPFFLLAARLVARSGHPVLLHGWNGADRAVRGALAPLGIAVAGSPAEASAIIAREGIAYLPLESLSPPLLALVRLREVLGLRSIVNTVLRMLNPGAAPAAVQGVFHPPYLTLQQEAGALLGQPALTVLKGGGGEFERHPLKDFMVFGLRGGVPWAGRTGTAAEGTARLATASTVTAPALWEGAAGAMAEATVLATAALALETLGEAEPMALATRLWADRHHARAA